MSHFFSLRLRIYLLLGLLAATNLTGGTITAWYSSRMSQILSSIIEKDVASLRVAEELEIALINQKGFVSYYFLDGDPNWLRQLGQYRQIFKDRLEKTREYIDGERQKEVLDKIEREYLVYIDAKDRVIECYKIEDGKACAASHQKARDHFFKTLQLCEDYKNIHVQRMLDAKKESEIRAAELRATVYFGVLTGFVLSLFLAFVLITQILGPVQELTRETETGRSEPPADAKNEIQALSQSVRGLIKDAGQTHKELRKSREFMAQSEKMVMVGKLAAGTAHSIRNPLTSVKMRLFSLSRSLELTETQQEDFDVISEEIRHVDTIVQNFLEFSRPPRLKMQNTSPSVVVDNAVQLLAHRLKSHDVEVKVVRECLLPEINLDPEQLKEVLANLMINACEALGHSGTIVVEEENLQDEHLGKAAVIKISDNGPGIPASIREKIFDPFFTTKDEGTGLGLSIAMRIVEEHDGILEVGESEEGGAKFTITIPISRRNDQ